MAASCTPPPGTEPGTRPAPRREPNQQRFGAGRRSAPERLGEGALAGCGQRSPVTSDAKLLSGSVGYLSIFYSDPSPISKLDYYYFAIELC